MQNTQNMTEDEQNSENIKHFRFSYSTDSGKFFRHTCISCGLDFKTQIDEATLTSSLEPAFREIGLEIGSDSHSIESSKEDKSFLTCPYCEYKAEVNEMHTEEFVTYVKRFMMREYILPSINKAMSALETRNRPANKGFISFSVSFEHHKPVLPPRPISGPEPPDMTIVELLCCGKKIKIIDGWYSLRICPFCNTNVSLNESWSP